MKSIITLAAILITAANTYAQRPYSDSERIHDHNIEEGITTLQLQTLAGKVPILYSKGYLVRAKAIQSIMQQCVAFYEKKFSGAPFDFQIFLLNYNDWQKANLSELVSYGMSDAEPLINKIFMAADKKAVGKLFGETDNSPDSVLSDFDCIALHELGHIFLIRYNHTNLYKMWANEFLASYFAICFFEQNKNYPGLPQVGETGYTPKYRTLADFEGLYTNVGAQNYGWYQAQFQNLGYELYPKFKTRLIKEFINNASPSGKKLDPQVLLQHLAPEIMNQWLKGME
ncbi:MAG: hypothetical protein LC128_01725 [Chitinophagales bacterium]|nr:hypothetical protein [Chitinophagales bacterium]